MKVKVFGTLCLLAILLIVFNFAPLTIFGAQDSTALQTDLTRDAYENSLVARNTFPVREVTSGIVAAALFLLWFNPASAALARLINWIRNHWLTTLAIPLMLMFAACAQVNIVTKDPNEALFTVPVVASAQGQANISSDEFAFSDDCKEQQANNPDQTCVEKVFATQIEVPRSWVCTSYIIGICSGGYWRPSSRVFVVNTTPINRSWVDMASAIPVESAESAGFSIPVIISAYLTEDDAPIAGSGLYDETGALIEGTEVVCQGANTYLNVYGKKVDINDDQVEVPAIGLDSVIDNQVKAAISTDLASRFAPLSITNAVAEKAQVLASMLRVIRPRFAAQGVCISDIGTTSGLLYDDPAYQAQIDNAAARGLDEDAARANATTTAIVSQSNANSTQIAVQAVATQQSQERLNQIAQSEAQATQNSIVRQGIVAEAQAQATAQTIRAEADAHEQEVIGRAIADNPQLIQMQYAENYAGGCTQNCFGSDAGIVPVYNVNPQPTQSAP